MKRIALLLIAVAIVPLQVKALDTYDHGDVLSYVAMPLAVAAVCDVRGVQTDRVGQLVSYMDQANVAPADFIDVFRYVPVALVLRTDGRPDFVEWVHGQVDHGLVGEGLVAAMETELRTYDTEVPEARYRTHRRFARDDYEYAYEPDYVPVVIREHCDRFLEDPLSLVEMPVAVADACDLGVPYDRVGGLVVELNLGDVPPVQFVELMRYAPAALVEGDGYYGQPDFIQFVHTRRVRGFNGDQLVLAADQQLRAYNIATQIDLGPPRYRGQTNYVPQAARNWVDPANQAYFPPVVSTRVSANFAAGRTAFNQPAPGSAASPQVQRLLTSPNGAAVVVNPAEARRELGRGNRFQRETPIAAVPTPFAGAAPGKIAGRGRHEEIAQQPVFSSPAVAGTPRGNGRVEHGKALTPMISSAPPAPAIHEHGRGEAVSNFAAPGAAIAAQNHEHKQGHAAAQFAPAPAFTPAPAPPHEHGGGHAPAFVAAPAVTPTPPHEHERGHAAAAAVAPAPAFTPPPPPPPPPGGQHGRGVVQPAVAAAPAPAAPAPPAGSPGQQKKKDKGKGND